MSHSFNPYSEWLGLPPELASPNHYELLGLSASESDSQKIATAADQATLRVRACKPGPHTAAWAQLLDQLAAIKACLTDPDQRAAYDQQLAAAPALGAATSAAMPQSPAPAGTPDPGPQPPQPLPSAGVPQAHAGVPGFPQAQPTAPLPQSIDPMAPVAAPVPGAPNPMAPVPQGMPQAIPQAAPQAFPQAASQPVAQIVPQPIPAAVPGPTQVAPAQAVVPGPQPMAPAAAIPVAPAQPVQPASAWPQTAPQTAPQVQPAGAALATPMPAAHPATPGPALPSVGAPATAAKPGVRRKASTTAMAKRRSSGGLTVPLVIGGAVAVVVLLVAGVAMWLNGTTPEPLPAVAATTPNTGTVEEGQGKEVERAVYERIETSGTPRTPDPEPPSEVMPVDPEPITPDPEPDPTPDTPEPEPPTPEPEPEPTDTGPTREEIRELATSLTTARDAISEQNFALAESELDKAETLANLDNHQVKVRRLRVLLDYVSRFRQAIDETLGRIKVGDQVELDAQRSFGIVEIGPDLLVIRYAGTNRRYTRTGLAIGLAAHLGEMSLERGNPDTIAMKSAFVAVNPKADEDDLEKVQQWWEEAASVQDLPDLIAALDDDYTLRQDLISLAMEPEAMDKLADRADKLKASRSLDDFVQEYQAAIDESLQNLEPGTELTVGNSTSVTVKEVKEDRIMLEVVGQTRGFRLNELPLGLASSIAEQTLPPDVPLTLVMRGAYFAARDQKHSNKQFRETVLTWWKEAGEADEGLQPAIEALVKQYPE